MTQQLERDHAEWMANIVHDAQQPANAILLGTELLLDAHLEGDALGVLRRIRASTEYLVRLIRDLNDAAILDEGCLALHRRDVQLGAMIDELVELERELWPEVRAHIEDRSSIVSCDPDRVRQVLENLVSNAIKYGQHDAPIEITVSTLDDDVCVTVANRGRGIAPDDVARIFERHTRTRHAVASGRPGAGLGLCIAKGLVEAHGGRIWVESIVDDTTRFHVALPQARRHHVNVATRGSIHVVEGDGPRVCR